LFGLTSCARKASSTPAKSEPAAVSALAFSPDGKKLAGSINPKVTVWDVESGKELATLEETAPGVSPLAFSADGQSIAGGLGNSVRIWDAATGKVRKTLEGHAAGITGVGFSADGKTLVSTAATYTFRTTIVELWVWDVEAGKKLAVINPKQFVITRLSTAPDRRTFATGSLDNSVNVWSFSGGKNIANLHHGGLVISLAYSPDGKILAVADAEPNVTLWDTGTWKEIGKIPNPEESTVDSLAFIQGGKFLAGGLDDKTIRIWEMPSGKLHSTLQGHSRAVKFLASSPDGKTLASGGPDGEIRLWDPSSRQTRITLK
jgi:WD40 repeat protein